MSRKRPLENPVTTHPFKKQRVNGQMSSNEDLQNEKQVTLQKLQEIDQKINDDESSYEPEYDLSSPTTIFSSEQLSGIYENHFKCIKDWNANLYMDFFLFSHHFPQNLMDLFPIRMI